MKKHAASLLILALVALPGLASAQTRAVIKANVPFDFTVSGQTILAGECVVQALGNGAPYLRIESGKQHLFVIPTGMQSGRASEGASLVFHRYGDRYFLASIKRAGETSGYALPAGKLEAELMAKNVAESDVVLLASAK